MFNDQDEDSMTRDYKIQKTALVEKYFNKPNFDIDELKKKVLRRPKEI